MWDPVGSLTIAQSARTRRTWSDLSADDSLDSLSRNSMAGRMTLSNCAVCHNLSNH